MRAILIISFFLISSCAKNNDFEIREIKQTDNSNGFFATLTNENGNWVLKDFSYKVKKTHGENSIPVNLITSQPVNADFTTKTCVTNASENEKFFCKEKLFRTKNVTASNVASGVVANTLSFGLPTLTGRFMYEESFSFPEFKNAYDTAIQREKTELNSLIHVHNSFMNLLKNTQEVCSNIVKQEDRFAKDSQAPIHNLRSEALNNLLKYTKINDYSGLYSKEDISLLINDKTISLRPRFTLDSANSILENRSRRFFTRPVRSPEWTYAHSGCRPELKEDFNDINEYKEYIEKNSKSLIEAFEYNNALPSIISKIFEELKSNLDFWVNISFEEGQEPYNLDSKLPDMISFRSGDLIPFDSTINIKSKNFRNLYPKNYKNSDENLEILQTGSLIRFTNLTDKFLTVKTVSVYYEKDISTLNNEIQLPPHSFSNIYLSDFKLSDKFIDKRDVTQENYNFNFLNYGFAVKYMIADTKTEKTLYKTKNHSIKEMI